MRVWLLPIVAMLAGLMVGCGAERAEFSSREEMNTLIPEVQEHVRHVLADEYFGSPTDPIAWERLPIKYHAGSGVFGETTAPTAGETVDTLDISLTSRNLPIASGDQIAWMSGKFLDQEYPNGIVDSLSESADTVTLTQQLQDVPAAGDRFVIGPGEILEQGRMLYAEHCQHCHGVGGDGNGPTAKYLNPRPRDYRLGKFKFTSTKSIERIHRDDLSNTILEGIPGTYMPSFKLLSETETQAIVEYVLWLSMRGEVEYKMVQGFQADYSEDAVAEVIESARESDEGLSNNAAREEVMAELQEYLAGDWVEEFDGDTKFLAENWQNAQQESAVLYPQTARVPDTPESRAEGRRLYVAAKAKCATCHGDHGLGNGSQSLSVQKNPQTNKDYSLPGLYDDWGNPLEPRNLTSGIYRGGRRPLDLYRRIHAGIKGTPMPAFGTVLNDEEIWHLVNYVLHIPFAHRDVQPGDGAKSQVSAPKVATKD